MIKIKLNLRNLIRFQQAAIDIKSSILFVTVLECKERWKNLRASFTRFLKSTNLSPGSVAKYKKPYYLAEYLHFLKPFTKSRNESGILQRSGQSCDSETESSRSASKLQHDRQQEDDVSQNEDPSWQEDKPEDFVTPATKKIKRTTSIEDVNTSRRTFQCYQSRNSSVQNEDEDPDMSFLKSVLPDMREMNAEQKRRFKIGILSLAQEILAENAASSVSDTIQPGS
jgi:hypothetical protein